MNLGPAGLGVWRVAWGVCLLLGLLMAGLLPCQALGSTVLGPWQPLFKGIDHAVGTNTPGGDGFATRQVANAIRIDLEDPDIRLFASPPIDNPIPNVRETEGRTVSDFLTTHGLQVAINANFFDPSQYYLPAGTPMFAYGLLVSEGTVVSRQDGPDHAALLAFSVDHLPTFIPTNWPPVATDGFQTAVSGEYPVLIDGVNVGRQYLGRREFIHRTNPRTAFGLSADRRTLYLLTIDGRQPGDSEGALDWEVAEWMLLLGAWDAINMDGGGSTTLVIGDSLGRPVELNHPSAVADSGRQRTVGAHFGVYAKPVPGFINDVAARTDDTSAIITWTTPEPATTQVRYGETPDLGSASPLDSEPVTEHTATLSGLRPRTTYYYQAHSTADAEDHQSATFAFTTANHVTTNEVVALSADWRFTPTGFTDHAWTQLDYDDSAWPGSGPALLWIDVRQTGPNPAVPFRQTELPADPSAAGYPYLTYYFRTHFTLHQVAAGSYLQVICYLDDGAVFYLNGKEVHRIHMPEAPTPIGPDTLATGFSFDGDATGTLEFEVAEALVPGDNVLAVEVHNYNARSPDTTFGASVLFLEPEVQAPALQIELTEGTLTLSWPGTSFTLEQADQPIGPWTAVPDGPNAGPHALPLPAATSRFYRLRR